MRMVIHVCHDILRSPAHPGLLPTRLPFSPVSAELARRLSSLTGIAGCRWEQSCSGAGDSRFFKAIGDVKSFFLKVIPSAQVEEHIFIDRIVAWVQAEVGFASAMLPGFPVPFDGSRVLCVYPWFGGEYFSVGCVDQLRRLSFALGRLHRTLASFPEVWQVQANKKVFFDKLSTIHRALALGTLASNIAPEKVRRIMQNFSLHENRDLTAATMLHGDINPGNVLFSPTHVQFVDFENGRFYYFPPEMELAFTLERFLLIHGDVPGDSIPLFLNEYSVGGGGVAAFDAATLMYCLKWLKVFALCRLQYANVQAESEWHKMLFLWDWLEQCEEEKQWLTAIAIDTADDL